MKELNNLYQFAKQFITAIVYKKNMRHQYIYIEKSIRYKNRYDL